MPTVFVTQDDPRKNITQALQFGTVEAVLEAPDEARLLNTPAIVAKIKRQLAKMTPDDYLLLMGNPVSIGICCAVAADITGGRFHLLKWDQQDRQYYPVAVDLNQDQSV